MQRAQLRSSGPQSASVFKKKASTSTKASTNKASTGKEIHIPHLLDEREHTPPPGFADERRGLLPTGAADEGRVSPPPGFDASIVLPPAWGVSLRALTDDLILPPGLSIGGPASRTRRSDRIAGATRKGPKTRGGAATGGTARGGATTDGAARGGAATRGCGPATRGGGATARGGGAAARGGAATRGGGAARGGGTAAMKGRGGGNVSSSNEVKGKRIVLSIEKGIEIMESKMKRKERDWKP
ncbi:hypothetical protein FH972_006066 [Carpinus fangiana]|uniref:Uncharacterized protein n=1 Tax=Carpinus fangiana TaxID=176857 RepID=A0A5N6QTJ0_9ROSI|nr:hypothetical protein FH972_006066 [Carpinus fangiana]